MSTSNDKSNSNSQASNGVEATAKANATANANAEIRFRIVEAADRDRVLNFLRIHYYHEEPLTIGSEPKQQDAADEEFNMSNIKHGMCVMALLNDRAEAEKEQEQERLVGVVISGPKDATEADHLFEEAARLGPTKWGHVMQFLACIERDSDVCRRFDVQKVLHAHVLAVDGSVRGYGIGARLMRELMQLGGSRGYPLLTVDCSSHYSAQLCERLGMECVNTINYAEYLDAEGKQVFRPPAPHTCIQTFAQRLSG